MKSLITMLLPLLRFTQLIIIIMLILYYTTTVYRNTVTTTTTYVVVISNNSVSVYCSNMKALLLVAHTLPLRYQYGLRFTIKL